MAEQPSNLPQSNQGNWKTSYMVGGAVIGAILGVITAYFMVRNSEETHGGPPEIKSIDIVRSGVGVAGLIRAIASLGD